MESDGTTLFDEKQSIDSQQISNNEFKPNTLTSDEKVMFEDSRVNSAHEVPATAANETECPSHDVQLDSFETELESSGHDWAQDDLVNRTTIPISVADVTSAELHPDKLAVSVELLDGAKTT